MLKTNGFEWLNYFALMTALERFWLVFGIFLTGILLGYFRSIYLKDETQEAFPWHLKIPWHDFGCDSLFWLTVYLVRARERSCHYPPRCCGDAGPSGSSLLVYNAARRHRAVTPEPGRAPPGRAIPAALSRHCRHSWKWVSFLLDLIWDFCHACEAQPSCPSCFCDRNTETKAWAV